MDCKEVNPFIYSFADGELAEPDLAVVHEHVESCAACRAAVEAQKRLRERLRQLTAGAATPASVKASLMSALQREGAVGAVTSSRTGGSKAGSSTRSFRLYRFLGPLAAIAAVIAIALVGYDRWAGDGDFGGAAGTQVAITDTSPKAVAIADRVYQLHLASMKPQNKHQDPALPSGGREAALAMSRDIRSTVLWCEQFASSMGEFESAEYCELEDLKGIKHRGAHLIFRCGEGPVSLVSFPKLDEMAEVKKAHYGSRDYAILCPSKCGRGRPTTVVGFDCPMGTHFVCAPMEPAKAVQLTNPMKPLHAGASASVVPLIVALGP